MSNHNYTASSIILLGYMGSGKSTIGAALSDVLDIPFTDLDALIESKYKMSVPELFVNKGAKLFRQIEHDMLKNTLVDTTPKVISLGGGTPCYHDNLKHILAATPHVFYLKATPSELADRLYEGRESRPLIAHAASESDLKEFIAKHVFERQTFYAQAPHHIHGGKCSIDEAVNAICALL
jgi:shikimate kinase